jgi:ribosomal protein L11 methylase PrmA
VNSWIQITLELRSQDADQISEWLWTQPGLLGLQETPVGGALFSPGEHDVLEFGSQAAKRFAKWLDRESYRGQDRVWIQSFWNPEQTLLRDSLKGAPVPCEWVDQTELPAEDYVQSYQAQVQATTLMDGRLWVGPPWLVGEESQAAEFSFIVEPGLAFGTGEHPTTQLCLEALLRGRDAGWSPPNVLDLGSGSGILSLAVLRFFPEARLWSADTDPQCDAELSKIFEMNAVSQEEQRRCQRVFGPSAVLQNRDSPLNSAHKPEFFDLVVSNIYAEVLADLVPALASIMRTQARWIASGILAGRPEDALIERARACFEEVDRVTRERPSTSLDLHRGLTDQTELWVQRSWLKV